MHKRKGVLANSSALVSLKLCIFFCLFLSFSALFILFIFFSAFLPLSHPSLSFSIPFSPSLILSASYLCFIPLLPFIYLLYPFLLFLAFIILKPFYSPYLSLYIPFYLSFLPCLCSYSLIISFTLVPVSFISMCSLCFIYSYSVVVIILLMCLSLCSLLPECLDALPHVPEVLYHL